MSRTRAAQPPALEPPLRRFGWRRLVYDMRTEGSGPGRESAAIGVGVFIGCLPLYGLHLIICILAGWLLRLNRLKLYLAANISNPFVAPGLLFAEVQAGSWLRRGRFHPVSLEAFETGAVVLGIDLVVGSVAVGTALGVLAAWGTFAMLRSDPANRPFVDLVRLASDRYVATSITAWEFARGKLRGDPVYRAAVMDGLLSRPNSDGPSTLVDVGCGQGLMLALLAELRRAVGRGEWKGADTPLFDRLIGIELRPNVAALARAALGDEAEIVASDVREEESLPPADIVLLFDVLHLMPAGDQEALLAALARTLAPGGVMLIREADASAGWKFTAVRIGNRLKALAVRRWRQTFHFRSRAEWLATFDALGLHADVRPMGEGTPFGNVLFRVTTAADAVTEGPEEAEDAEAGFAQRQPVDHAQGRPPRMAENRRETRVQRNVRGGRPARPGWAAQRAAVDRGRSDRKPLDRGPACDRRGLGPRLPVRGPAAHPLRAGARVTSSAALCDPRRATKAALREIRPPSLSLALEVWPPSSVLST